MTAVAILQAFGLSITKSRINLLTAFLEVNTPLTLALLLNKNLGYDRITIHRILKVLVKKGILHIIPSTDNRIFYKLKVSISKPDGHHTAHPHFICNNCKSTLCLENQPSLKIKVPEGYKVENIEIVINGKCNSCGEL